MNEDPFASAPPDLQVAGQLLDRLVEKMLSEGMEATSVASACLGGALALLARAQDDAAVLRILDNARASVARGDLAQFRGPTVA